MVTSQIFACTQAGTILILLPSPRVNEKAPKAASRAARLGNGLKLGKGGQLGSRTGVDETFGGGALKVTAAGCSGREAEAGFQACTSAGFSSALIRRICPSGPVYSVSSANTWMV